MRTRWKLPPFLADEYINQVYFSGQRRVKKDDAFVLGTDLKKEASDFRAKFAADFTRKLHDYQSLKKK